MVSYKTEVLPMIGAISEQRITQQVQSRVESFAAGGWRLSAMAGVGGMGGFFGGATNPYLVLVFEHE